MVLDKGDAFKGFLIGIISSITAVILWDYYKKKQGTLEYGEQKVIDEIKSSIEGLKQDIEFKKSNS
jgi:hypothetical protein